MEIQLHQQTALQKLLLGSMRVSGSLVGGDWVAVRVRVVHISKLTIATVVVTFANYRLCWSATRRLKTIFSVDGPLKLITDNTEKDNALLLPLQLAEKQKG